MKSENRRRLSIIVSTFLTMIALAIACSNDDGSDFLNGLDADVDAETSDTTTGDASDDADDVADISLVVCEEIDDPGECDQEPACGLLRPLRIDAEEIQKSGGNCEDFISQYDWPDGNRDNFCFPGEWTTSDQPLNITRARYDATNDEWTIYHFGEISVGFTEMGFEGCHAIPEDEHPEARQLCYEC